MLTDLLIKGAIRLGICHVAAIGASKVIEASGTIDKSIPDFYYRKKKEKRNPAWYLADLVFFVPVLGTIVTVITLLGTAGATAAGIIAKKNPSFAKDLGKDMQNKYELPDAELKRLENGEKMQKAITDTLKMEGLSDEEIKKFMKEARKEDPTIREDNSREISKDKQKVANLELLDSVKDYLEKPSKAYKFTVNKQIQFADVKDDQLILGVTKPGKDPEKVKVRTKKFKLAE